MANTPNMNLQLPVVGGDTGLTWELSINNNSNILDLHNHTPGSGVQITPLGLNINAALNFQGNQATNLSGVAFSAPGASSSTTFLYTNSQSGGGIYDLFYNDGAGNVIPITKAGIVNAVASSIPGESYSGGTFTWKQGSGSTTPANFDIGTITIRPNTAGTTNGITLETPAGIASAYSVVLPALPGSQSFMTLDASGNITGYASINQGISRNNLVAVGQQVSSSCGNFSLTSTTQTNVTNLSKSITTSGRPVMLLIQSDGSGNSAVFGVGPASSGAYLIVLRNGTEIIRHEILLSGSSANYFVPMTLAFLDVVGASTYTYQVQVKTFFAATTIFLSYSVLVVYEL